jgi:hypothetical protein
MRSALLTFVLALSAALLILVLSASGAHAATTPPTYLVWNNGDINSPQCTTLFGVSYCTPCFANTPGVDCAFLGQSGCTDGEGYKTDKLLTFDLETLPDAGYIGIIGGEHVKCFLNGIQVLTLDTRNNCGTTANAEIPSSAFLLGMNTLMCSVAGGGEDEDNGFKLTSFSYSLPATTQPPTNTTQPPTSTTPPPANTTPPGNSTGGNSTGGSGGTGGSSDGSGGSQDLPGEQALPLTIEEVKADGTVLTPSGTNRLSVLRGEPLAIRIILQATDDVRNAKVRVLITDTDEIEAETDSFDIDVSPGQVVNRAIKLTLDLPDDLETGPYKLRVFVSDRNSIEVRGNYDLLIDTLRHDTSIRELIINPGTVMAGDTVQLSARVRNAGSLDEENIKLAFRIPALGLGGTLYLDDLDGDEDGQPEDPLELRIPCSAEPGTYTVQAEMAYDKGRREDAASGDLAILENPACEPSPTTIIVQQPPLPVQSPAAPPAPRAPAQEPLNPDTVFDDPQRVRGTLEIAVLVLISILMLVGVIAGLTRLRDY